jgi:hypothetical protein
MQGRLRPPIEIGDWKALLRRLLEKRHHLPQLAGDPEMCAGSCRFSSATVLSNALRRRHREWDLIGFPAFVIEFYRVLLFPVRHVVYG